MRINVIPVELLSDVHLRAEFREINMAFHYYRRSKNSKAGLDPSRISPKYTLNKGHAYFFYDKFKFVYTRFKELKEEMIYRGYNQDLILAEEKVIDRFYSLIPDEAKGDYEVTKQDMIINLGRILYRINTKIFKDKKPKFYTRYDKVLTYEEWVNLYKKELNINGEIPFIK